MHTLFFHGLRMAVNQKHGVFLALYFCKLDMYGTMADILDCYHMTACQLVIISTAAPTHSDIIIVVVTYPLEIIRNGDTGIHHDYFLCVG